MALFCIIPIRIQQKKKKITQNFLPPLKSAATHSGFEVFGVLCLYLTSLNSFVVVLSNAAETELQQNKYVLHSFNSVGIFIQSRSFFCFFFGKAAKMNNDEVCLFLLKVVLLLVEITLMMLLLFP